MIIITCCISKKCIASECVLPNASNGIIYDDSVTIKPQLHHTDSILNFSLNPVNQNVKPKRRIVAAFLCITLGPFGMHRLYLGTKPRVAAAYTLTLGGGLGLIPLIDLFHIVFSKDISRFKDNDQFIMWAQ
ncbi:MAG TPA: TM2 domain-containing protein [Flavobacteriales bacterium]|nr:TM2 domain-containing protein [Flavobacteriales bacterium]